VQPVLEVV